MSEDNKNGVDAFVSTLDEFYDDTTIPSDNTSSEQTSTGDGSVGILGAGIPDANIARELRTLSRASALHVCTIYLLVALFALTGFMCLSTERHAPIALYALLLQGFLYMCFSTFFADRKTPGFTLDILRKKQDFTSCRFMTDFCIVGIMQPILALLQFSFFRSDMYYGRNVQFAPLWIMIGCAVMYVLCRLISLQLLKRSL